MAVAKINLFGGIADSKSHKAAELDTWLAGGADIMALPEVLGEAVAVWGEMLLAATAIAGPMLLGSDMLASIWTSPISVPIMPKAGAEVPMPLKTF